MLKHVFATVITSMALLATGAVSTAGTATTAAPESPAAVGCAYPDTITTFTSGRFARNPIPSGTRARLFVRVRASGTARVPNRGRVIVRVAGTRTIKRINDGAATFRFPRLRGYRNRARSYDVRIRFSAPSCSVFRNSSTDKTLRVRSRR